MTVSFPGWCQTSSDLLAVHKRLLPLCLLLFRLTSEFQMRERTAVSPLHMILPVPYPIMRAGSGPRSASGRILLFPLTWCRKKPRAEPPA